MAESGTTDRPLKPFFVLWTGQALSLLGSMSVQFALIWWLTAETGSAAVLATATLLGIAPQTALGPFIGALVDRWDRKRIMLAADSAIALASLVLALLFALDLASVGAVLTMLFVRGIGGAFHTPAMMASTSLMVPEKHLTRIQGLNQTIHGGQLIITAPLGALLYSTLPMAGVMAVDVGTALIAIVPLLFIHVPRPRRSESETQVGIATTLNDVLAGFRYLRDRSGQMTLLGMSAVINLCMLPAFSLLPLLVVEQQGGAAQLGWMNSMFGVGTIFGGIALGVWGGFKRRIYTTFAGLIAAGLATLALGAAPTWSLAMVAMAAVGLSVPFANGPIQAVLQATVAPEFQGRVFTLYASLGTLVAPIGLLLAAPVAEVFGVRVWYAAGGLACVSMGVVSFFIPSIARLEPSAASSSRESSQSGEVAA